MIEGYRELYADPGAGGADPGAGFEEYLTRLDLAGIWLAERTRSDEGVVGLVGLVMEGRAARVEPLIVARHRRDEGVGLALLEFVAGQARRRELTHLTVSPAARDVEAIRWYHGAGFTNLATVTLTLAVTDRRQTWRDGVDLHDLRFSY